MTKGLGGGFRRVLRYLPPLMTGYSIIASTCKWPKNDYKRNSNLKIPKFLVLLKGIAHEVDFFRRASNV